mgnify:CR=1 FL=1
MPEGGEGYRTQFMSDSWSYSAGLEAHSLAMYALLVRPTGGNSFHTCKHSGSSIKLSKIVSKKKKVRMHSGEAVIPHQSPRRLVFSLASQIGPPPDACRKER